MSSSKEHDLVYKALADHRRREILDLLKDEPKTTGDICAKFKKLHRYAAFGSARKSRIDLCKKGRQVPLELS
jgi:DNA-binding transcriptional ArsR family regulator